MNTNEQIIANFLRPPGEGGAYTDEKLAALLAHAEDGKLAFNSCCCLIGIPTAPHALVGEDEYRNQRYAGGAHDFEAARSFGNGLGDDAETAFCGLAPSSEERRAALIPLIRSEMERRESVRAQVDELELVTV